MEAASRLLPGLWNAICAAPHDGGADPHGLEGPFLGNVLVAGFAGLITLICFIVLIRLLIYPGEGDPRHPKYLILNADR